MQPLRIALVGCGAVGATFAYTVLLQGLADELVIIDANRDKALGDVLDLNHGLMLTHRMKITLGDYPDCAGAGIIVITAGAAQKPGETRIDLMHRNVAVFRSIIAEITRYCRDAIILVATNPVDIMTQVALKLSGWPAGRVFGSGTLLDTSRLRYLVAAKLRVDPRSVHGWIVGEHGDSEVPIWSSLSVAAGTAPVAAEPGSRWHLSEADRSELYAEVRGAAAQIIQAKGATCYAIALALARICEAIIHNQRSVLPVSTYLEEYHGISGLCLGVPAIVGRGGVEELVPLALSEEEGRQLGASADKLRTLLAQIGF